jgi:hypothetical protein
LAAEQGSAKAQYNLGAAYYLGTGVSVDYAQAYAWFSLVGPRAEMARATVLKTMTPEQIAEGKRLAEEYAKKYLE